MVSVVGASFGLLLAHWLTQLILALHPPEIQRPELIEINLPVFAFAAAASLLTTLLFGLAPSIVALRADLNSTLKSGKTVPRRSATSGRTARWSVWIAPRLRGRRIRTAYGKLAMPQHGWPMSRSISFS